MPLGTLLDLEGEKAPIWLLLVWDTEIGCIFLQCVFPSIKVEPGCLLCLWSL